MAKIIATAAKLLTPGGAVAYIAIEPITVMPDNAFIPDMSGVCNKEGTADITRYPNNAQTTRNIIIVGVILNNLPAKKILAAY